MINVSAAFLQEMYQNDNRKYTYTIDCAFRDGTTDTFTNEDLYNGGVSIEDSVSSDEKLEFGTATINQCTIVLENFNEQWNSYDFTDAIMTVYIGLEIDGTEERFQKGIFIVDEQNYDSSLLTLTCLDYMGQFEVDYAANSTLTYPATLLEIVEEACTVCGVDLATTVFPNSDMSIATKPVSQGMTFRTIVSWVAMCAGCNARINRFGELEIKCYDFGFLAWFPEDATDDWTNTLYLVTEDGEYLTTEDGERIILDNAALNVFPSLYTISAAPNDTTITGVRVVVENIDAETSADALLEYTYGTDEYEIVLENNYLITKDIAQDVADSIGERLVGSVYRKASYSHLSDPLVEAGDVALIFDGKGRVYRTIVSTTTFTANERQTTVSAGENPPRVITTTAANTSVGAATPVITTGKNATRYSDKTEQFIRSVKAANSVGGLHCTKVGDATSGYTYYLHNKPDLDDSDVQIVFSVNGIMVTANGTDDEPTWYGLEPGGEMFLNILEATGINADWITTGALVIYDEDGNELFLADKTNRTFTWDTKYSRLYEDGNLVFSDDGTNQPATFWKNTNDTEALYGTNVSSAGIIISEALSSSYYDYVYAEFYPDGIYIHAVNEEDEVDTTICNFYVPGDDSVYYSGAIFNDLALEEWIEAVAKEQTSRTLSKPSSLTNFSFGTTWGCTAKVNGAGVVMLKINFNGYFTATSTTGGTLFTLPSAYRPEETLYFNRVNQSGTRYLLTINTSGAVTLQNTSGAAGSSNQFFRDVFTFLSAYAAG